VEENANETVPRARVFKSYNINPRSTNDVHPQPLDRTRVKGSGANSKRKGHQALTVRLSHV